MQTLHVTMNGTNTFSLKVQVIKTVLCILQVMVVFFIKGIGTVTNQDDITTSMPQFREMVTNVTFVRGEIATLHCFVDHLGTKTVVWRKSSDPNPLTIGAFTFVADDRIRVHHTKGQHQWNLVIKQVRLEDRGVYECQISSKHRINRRLVMLHVIESRTQYKAAHPGIKIAGSDFVEKGNQIQLRCNATGNGYLLNKIDWFKDGQKVVVDTKKGISISNRNFRNTHSVSSKLEIESAQMDDAGTYVCRISDTLVTSSKVMVLNAGTSNVKRGTSQSKMDVDSGGRTHVVTSQVVLALLLLTRLSAVR